MRRLVVTAVLGVAVVAGGCGTGEESAGGADSGNVRDGLVPVSLPDVSRMDPPVQEQIRDQYALVNELLDDEHAATADLGQAFGTLGMLLQAAEYYDAADPCYRNAESIMPQEVRWPYFLAQLHHNRGELVDARAAFERALALRPNDWWIRVRLGQLFLDEGEATLAEPQFDRAVSLMPGAVSALAGLGQVALLQQDYATAVEHLEAALQRSPDTLSLHAPLAQAYQQLGDADAAEAHLALWENVELPIPDPLTQELDTVLESALSYELRGVRALEAQQFGEARDLFAQGLALTASDAALRRSLHHKLGTALAQTGDIREAVEHFQAAAALAPAEGRDEASARAHYSLGVVMASAGRGDEAVEHFQTALEYQPGYAEARLALADALRRAGRIGESLPLYLEVLELNPADPVAAQLGYAFGLVRTGRHREALAFLENALRRTPNEPALLHTLARLLSASPDDRVRDGQRAGEIVKQLLQGQRTPELGETAAMSSAEMGYYDEAVTIQRSVIESIEQAGLEYPLDHLRRNLAAYERYEAVRTPWEVQDPVFSPGPPVDPVLAEILRGL